jgi:hydroxypyruvate reductase
MAEVLERHRNGLAGGLVVTRYGHGVPTRAIEVIEAAHPVPDGAGAEAARRVLALVADLGPDDLVLCLLSGGGSALLACPADGITLEDKQATTGALLASGATIAELNCVRKHLSAIKGGRLAIAAAPARVVTLMISDVPGDDPAVIASGPTVADPTTLADARAVIERYGISAPAAVSEHLNGDARLARAEAVIAGAAKDALGAAARACETLGYRAIVLGDDIEGEAREVARAHADLAHQHAAEGGRMAILSGGEVTVTVRGKGRGGPNTEYALALALALEGAPGITALACDTDGIDGSGDNAGAAIAPDTLARASALGLDPRAYLEDNDSYGFFAGLGDLFVTGPTHTNVSDFRAIVIDDPSRGTGGSG